MAGQGQSVKGGQLNCGLPLWPRSGGPELELLDFLLELPESAATPADVALKTSHVCSQPQA